MLLILPDISWVASATNKQLLEVAGNKGLDDFVQTVKSSPKPLLILPDVPWVATATNKQLLEVAGSKGLHDFARSNCQV